MLTEKEKQEILESLSDEVLLSKYADMLMSCSSLQAVVQQAENLAVMRKEILRRMAK